MPRHCHRQHRPVRRPARWLALAAWAFASCAAILPVHAQEQRWAAPTTQVEIPKSPADPTAAKVYAVFDKQCASCHQNGRLTIANPAGAFGGILDLATLAADGTLIRPGQPDASPLYMLLQASPGHGTDAAGKDVELTATELAALRDWIGSLKAQDRCSGRAPTKRQDASDAMARYLDTAGTAAKDSRFLTLTHLYNACASDTEMKTFRQAVTLAVNSLSWGLKPIVVPPIDDAGMILRIDLAAMGWDDGRWNRLVASYPYRGIDAEPAATVAGAAPLAVRADWFVVAALSPPLYYELLGLPDRVSTLTASLRVDLANDVALNRARRIGLKTSPIARGSRLLQRSQFANGAFWTTYEYAPTPGRTDLFEAPAGPGTRGAPRPDGSLVMFALPSGFNAFFMANADGVRLNEMPLSVLRNDMHPARRLTVGARCMSCHTQGPRMATDELRARVLGDTAVPRDIRDKVLALHGAEDEIRKLISDDTGRVNGAMAEAGVVPGATLDGVDPISVMTRRYEQDVTLEALAAELDVPPRRFAEMAGKANGIAGDLVERVVHGPIPRRHVEAGITSLAAAVRTDVVPPPEQVPVTAPDASGDEPAPRLVLKTGQATFKVGDALTITARASEGCYFTLINVDRNGRGTVVYPNDFEQNNYLDPAKEIRVPADGAPYVFRLREPGRETLVGICQTGTKALNGIRHDFERQRFTELGDYKAFLARLNLAEAETRATPAQAKGTAPDPRSRRRGRVTAAPGASSTPATRGEVQMRASAMIEVVP